MIPCQASREAMGNLVYNLGTDYTMENKQACGLNGFVGLGK